MLLGTSRNGRLEVSQYSVSTTSGAVSVIRRDAKRNTSGLTAAGSLNTCPICEGQRWIFNVLTILFWYTKPPSFRPRSEKLNNFWVRSLLKTFCHMTQLELDLPTVWLTVYAFSNCPTLTPWCPLIPKKLKTIADHVKISTRNVAVLSKLDLTTWKKSMVRNPWCGCRRFINLIFSKLSVLSKSWTSVTSGCSMLV